jgi:hypothetical protein
MTDEFSSPDIQGLWQNQPTEPPKISPEELRHKMNKFERRIFLRNIREYAAGVFVVAGFGFYEWKFPAPLMRLGSGLVIAGTLYVMFQLHRRASFQPAPAGLGLNTCIEFHRQSLERQRDALRSVWSWYLLPLVPGLAVFMLGAGISQLTAHPEHLGRAVMSFSVQVGVDAVVFFGIWKLNQYAAGKLQAQIDEITALPIDPDQGLK